MRWAGDNAADRKDRTDERIVFVEDDAGSQDGGLSQGTCAVEHWQLLLRGDESGAARGCLQPL